MFGSSRSPRLTCPLTVPIATHLSFKQHRGGLEGRGRPPSYAFNWRACAAVVVHHTSKRRRHTARDGKVCPFDVIVCNQATRPDSCRSAVAPRRNRSPPFGGLMTGAVDRAVPAVPAWPALGSRNTRATTRPAFKRPVVMPISPCPCVLGASCPRWE